MLRKQHAGVIFTTYDADPIKSELKEGMLMGKPYKNINDHNKK